VDGGGEHVVRALPHVDVIVGVNGFFRLKAVAAENFNRPVGDDLVGVHVARCAGAGLEDVDGKFVVELPRGDFAAGLQERIDLAVV
jgi:hypothetical protein